MYGTASPVAYAVLFVLDMPQFAAVSRADSVSLTLLLSLFQVLPQNGPSSHRGDGEPGGIPLAMIVVPGLALTVAAVWAYLRFRQRV